MTEKEMWEAVVHSDAGYDGRFFYAVKTTGIFCRPSCCSKPPRRENVCYFPTAEAARAVGFRPCKRCRSDLPAYEPLREIAAEAKEKIDAAVSAGDTAQLGDIGLTPRRLTDIFKQTYGVTPKEYADRLRRQAAERMLTRTDAQIVDIACAAGFASLATFNRFFKQRIGCTPSAYRKEHTDP